MRKIVIKDWPYPEKTKAMLLRVGNPVYDGNGNWHTDVIFRSINKEDKKVTMDWGLLPMLKTGQIFSDGSKIYDQTKSKIGVFTFDHVEFKFYVDQIRTKSGIIQRPAFRARINDIYYHIPAIEIIRSCFARTRRLSYALLEANSILPLCQCQISKSPAKRVTVRLSPECPAALASEKWILTLVWMATDLVAQKSWSSFFLYFKACQGMSVFPTGEEEIPTFPLDGKFSLTCGYRIYGKNMWLDEIIKVDCDSINFDEIVVEKYTPEKRSGSKTKVRVITKSDSLEIVNSAKSAHNRHILTNENLPNFMFKKQPKINIVRKSIGMKLDGYRCVDKIEANIEVTGKNEGFTDALTGIEFSLRECNIMEQQNNDDLALTLPDMKEAEPGYFQYNQSLIGFLASINLLSKKVGVLGVNTKVYELPGEASFTWILPNVRRCFAISRVKLLTGKELFIIEVDRSIIGLGKRWHVSTLILEIQKNNPANILTSIVHLLSVNGYWAESKLNNIEHITYVRLKHGNEDPHRWAQRMWSVM